MTMERLPPEPVITVRKGIDDAAFLSSQTLQKIKAHASREETAEMKKRVDAERTKLARESKERKEKMIELAEEGKRNAPVSETQRLEAEQQSNLIQKAQAMLSEEKDDVKHMNQMMLYAKCVTIRDAQLEEKKKIETEKESEKERLDRLMEIERLKGLSLYEEREMERQGRQRHGAAVLKEQMAEREKQRLHELDLQEQERQQIVANIEQLKKAEQEKIAMQKEDGRKLLMTVQQSNAEQIQRKQLLTVKEKEDDKRIAQYLYLKDKRDQERFEEEERKRIEREHETARLRALQEKIIDRRSEEDELRAKRVFEQKEREWRKKEKEERERQVQLQQTLAFAREAQKMEKQKKLALEARSQREEYERILAVQTAEREEEIRREREALDRRLNLKSDLLTQISEKEERGRRDRVEFLSEGTRQRLLKEQENAELERIKQQKLNMLAAQGVPAKYQSELVSLQVHYQ